MATDYQIGLRFRAINDWCTRSGTFMAGWPNFHEATYANPQRKVYGHFLLKDAVVDWQDVPAVRYNANNARTKFTGAHDYARSQGYQHGFPNFHQANYGQGVVYGTFLIVPGTCVWRDVPVNELGLGYGDPTRYTMDWWFKGASDYAARNGFAAGMPNGHYANSGNGYVCGVFLFLQSAVEWRDIRGNELGLPDVTSQSSGGSGSGSGNGSSGGGSGGSGNQNPAIAELTFINTWIEPTAFPRVGQPFVVYFSFGNQGNAATGNFTARLQLDNNTAVQNISVPSFVPGRVDTLFWYFPSGLPVGSHFIYAYLDINNQVKEVTKQNNVSYNGFSVSM